MKKKPLDYSKKENWLVKQSKGTKKVDSIFFTPTNDGGSKARICGINNKVRQMVAMSYKRAAKGFESFANGYVPLFHQITTQTAITTTYKQMVGLLSSDKIKNDIFAALDYYFKHYNKNKPYILSGICQGTIILKYVLSEYMKKHPDYYKRMIACYAIAGSINKKYLKDNPHVKTAKGELDTGVVISYNTFPDNSKPFYNYLLYDHPYCINPLNWKTDSTYANKKLNKGYLQYKTLKLKKGLIDARIDTSKHVLLSKSAFKLGIKPWDFHDKFINSYHLCEWDLYYENIKINAYKRTKQFLKNWKR